MGYPQLVRFIDKQCEIIQRAYSDIDNLGRRLGITLKDFSDEELKECIRLIDESRHREWSAKGHFSTILYEREQAREAQGIVAK